MTDPKEEIWAAVAARFAREEERWRRENPGKVRFYLRQAPDESPTFSVEGQAALRKVVTAIRENQIKVDAPVMALDSAEAVGGFTGEIAVLIQAVSPILTGILGAWLQSKAGRKVRLKIGDIEVEARTVEEADQLLQRGLALQASQESAKGHTESDSD
ncbi:hypothetical protein [Burkholderia thailandensis]|uniref:hypothetical protein n=1 Tax=Burkholderia thailandensis TaxID=57975 RepID=UPI00107EDA63|nr:hypothetical protein [Burkholderia thailandensis]TGB31561.1 hypothetical protein C6946_22385 [Burkholderia thailandensis]